jgi:hypothetical protein
LIDSAIEVASQRARQMPRPDTVRETIEVEAAKQIPRLRRIPQRVDELLGQATRGRLTARISLFADDDDLRTITRLVDRAVLAMVTSALGIGSVLLLHTSGPAVGASVDVNEVLGYIGIAVSSILALRIIAGVIRDGVL